MLHEEDQPLRTYEMNGKFYKGDKEVDHESACNI
jgi:hypothetical protein